MDHDFDFATAGAMRTAAFLSFACVLTLLVQTGFISTLPDPWRFFPLFLIAGVIVLQEKSLSLGSVWLASGGLIMEARGLGTGLALAAFAASFVAVFLASGVFAKRSLFALVGVTVSTALVYGGVRLAYLLVLHIFTPIEFSLGSLIAQMLYTALFSLIGAIFIGTYVRRFRDWSRTWFVRRPDSYDTSSLT